MSPGPWGGRSVQPSPGNLYPLLSGPPAGLAACDAAFPPPPPACGPQCPGGGPAVWTGTAAPSTGGSVNIIASIFLQLPYTIVGSWSCSPGTAPCFAAGGTLLGSGVGANF